MQIKAVHDLYIRTTTTGASNDCWVRPRMHAQLTTTLAHTLQVHTGGQKRGEARRGETRRDETTCLLALLARSIMDDILIMPVLD